MGFAVAWILLNYFHVHNKIVSSHMIGQDKLDDDRNLIIFLPDPSYYPSSPGMPSGSPASPFLSTLMQETCPAREEIIRKIFSGK